jgi:hypothetical protein
MDHFEQNLLAFLERQAERLLKLADHCTDDAMREHFATLATNSARKLGVMPRE